MMMEAVRRCVSRMAGRQDLVCALGCIIYYAATGKRTELNHYGLRKLARHFSRSGIFQDEDDLGMCALDTRAKVDWVVQRYSPGTVLDLGAGMGVTLGCFLAHGVDAYGMEASDLARSRSAHQARITGGDLRKTPLPRLPLENFDLVWCFEVAEHIHESFVEAFMTNLTQHGKVIMLSAASPGQGGEGHFNEQPQEYWIAKLKAKGFELDKRATRELQHLGDDLLSANCMLFERQARIQAEAKRKTP